MLHTLIPLPSSNRIWHGNPSWGWKGLAVRPVAPVYVFGHMSGDTDIYNC